MERFWKLNGRFEDRQRELDNCSGVHPTQKIKLFPMKQVPKPEITFWAHQIAKRVFRSWHLFHWKEHDFLGRIGIFPIAQLIVTISKTLNYFLQFWATFGAKIKQFRDSF